MQTQFLLAGVLLGSAPVFAQVQAPVTAQTAESSGYDLLVEAGTKILPGPNGSPSAAEILAPDENLKRQRLAVARDAPALALVRQALQKPIEVPPSTDDFLSDIKMYAKVRELARQFVQESDVRRADGDYAGALNSKLDAIQMGLAYERGTLLNMLVGVAAESMGRDEWRDAASRLGAAQCRAIAARLRAIEAGRPSYSSILEREQQQVQKSLIQNLDGLQKEALSPEKIQNLGMDTNDAALVRGLTPEKIKDDAQSLFAQLQTNASLPFSQTVQVAAIADPLVRSSADVFVKSNPRFIYEHNRTEDLLLESALELSAVKLETGKYPATFTTPIDPFSPDRKPLVYRTTATGYVLYSVGPDGKDDGGRSVQTTETSPAGIVTVSNRVRLDSQGDIVQYPF